LIQVASSLSELASARRELILRHYGALRERPVVGLTPTMGALHAGHAALIARMAEECGVSIVSLFVNPRQFGPREDFKRYPRMIESDLALCEAAGAQIVFTPRVEEMYPEGYATSVSVAGLTARWCGASRPGHFDGVATIVAKLFAMCAPERAYFGEKDFQQLTVIQRMVTDLNLAVKIVPCTTQREADGLAMSSRNAYLSPEERAAAPRLYQALQHLAELFHAGERDGGLLLQAASSTLAASSGPQFVVEYLAVVDSQTLEPQHSARTGNRVLVAARLGATRLIDNIAL
jgi:pantoate--beta-alanine ligase